MTLEFFTQFGTAFLLGLLIGSERERRQQHKHIQSFAGVRSFVFMSLLGFFSAYVNTFLPWFAVVSYTLFFLLILGSYLYNAFILGHEGVTTELAAVLTFMTGILCYGQLAMAVVLGILVTVLLTLKDFSHQWLQRLNNEEFFATIKFAIIAFIILPFLPNEALDPWGIWRPYATWLIVVFICGISFLGYILMKLVGLARGSWYTALFGGIASSTAVNAAYSEESKLLKKNNMLGYRSLVAGVLLAMATSFLRILFFVYAINIEFFQRALWPVIILFAVFVLLAGVIHLITQKHLHSLVRFQLPSPFRLKTALEFGVILTVILFVAELGRQYFGEAGIYITSIFSGIARGEAIAIAVAKMSLTGEISYTVAVRALLLSMTTSFFSKYVVARLTGTKLFASFLGKMLLIPLAAVIMLFVIYGMGG